MIYINMQGLEPYFSYTKLELSFILKKILFFLKLEHASLEFELVRDGAMASLNSQYMNCQGPTNVLSFPSMEEDNAELFLGSIVMSVDTLRREAKLYGQNEKTHALNLIIHAMVHLMGYDHGHEMDTLCYEIALFMSKETIHQD